MPKKPFTVLEAGCGRIPIGLVRKASRALEKGKTHRRFIGIDDELNLDLLMKKLKLQKLPKNLQLMEKCAIKYLKRTPPGSMDLIFGSYLLNNLAEKWSCVVLGYSCREALLGFAKKALKPGGRMIFIIDKINVEEYRETAAANGMNFHAVELPDKVLKKSPAEHIRLRATLKKRKKIARWYAFSEFSESAKKQFGPRVAANPEIARPTAIIMQKPKKEKIRPIVETSHYLTELSLEEQELVKKAHKEFLENLAE